MLSMQGFEQRDKYKRFYQASQDKSTVEPRFTYTDTTLLCTVFFVPGKSPEPALYGDLFFAQSKDFHRKSTSLMPPLHYQLRVVMDLSFLSEGKKTFC